MDAAFDKLTNVQKANVNKEMFVRAYNCIARSRNSLPRLMQEIDAEIEREPHLRDDLIRYCKLIQRIW